MSALESQLLELEKTYPYNVFLSIGAIVGKFECSICGNDIDSFQCAHRKGQLYGGEMAIAVAKDIKNLDHIALVDQPADKRCVISYKDSSDHFKLVRLLSKLINKRIFLISDFGILVFSTRSVPNPKIKSIGRNDDCFCGSGLKFKRCCNYIPIEEHPHVDITPHPIKPERAIP